MPVTKIRISARPLLQDVIFSVQFFAALFLINLPVQTYAGFVRFREAGLSEMPYFQWLSASVLDWAVLTVFNIVGVVAVIALIRRRPQSWGVWATAVYILVSGTYVLVSPQFIEPLFNQITPLAESAEKEAVLSLARANGVPSSDVFVRDASRQSVLLNAHVSGFGGAATIVLDDNTTAHTSLDEIEMVMAHEIGHYVLGHAAKGVIFDGLVMGFGILLVVLGSRRLAASYGARWQVSGLGDIGALPVIWCLFVLWGYVALPATNGISRMHEVEADLFGLNATRHPVAMAEFMIRDSDAGQPAHASAETFPRNYLRKLRQVHRWDLQERAIETRMRELQACAFDSVFAHGRSALQSLD